MVAIKIVSVSDLKTNLARILTQMEKDGAPVFVTQHSKPKAVLVQHEEYEALMEKLEDLEDILAMEQTLAADASEAINLEDYDRRRAANISG